MRKKLVGKAYGMKALDMSELKGSRDKIRNRRLRRVLQTIISMCGSGSKKAEIVAVAQKALNDD